MSQIQPPAPTITLKSVKQKFKDWRDTRKHRSRIPDELWEAAASLSGQYSVHYISKTLRVNHSALRDRVAARSMHENMEGQTCFFELPPPASLPIAECLVEMENSQGDKMRMHFAGEVNLDLLALGQDFWRKCS
ncbi:MAG: hypothetical protein U9Q61_03165 [Thermodesulfobacteriota bacterium]|nr:hypothetical protein [Thermodesulfobacteriota bacterium]